MDRYKTVCCTGSRPQGFAWGYKNKNHRFHKVYMRFMKLVVEQYIKDGFIYFVSGGAKGVDMDFAETVLDFREKYPHIRLEIAVPCPNQTKKWTNEEKTRYQNILDRANTVTLLSQEYTATCMMECNEYMVNKSNAVIVFWNGSPRGGACYTIDYARKRAVFVDSIFLPSFLYDADYKEYLLSFKKRQKE